MKLSDFTLLVAETARSYIYLQKFEKENIKFGSIIILRNPNKKMNLDEMHLKTQSLNKNNNLHIPSFTKDIIILANDVSNNVTVIESDSIKDQAIANKIAELNPKFIVYSGFGGQIVPRELLSNTRFIHAHAGWLPEYRGSTTTYYSLIDRGDCAVSVIELKPEIDTGDILARKRYSPPYNGEEIDYIYDNQIRADLLSEVLIQFGEKKEFEMVFSQNEAKSTTYFVIHPVLKHLALLSLNNE
jgi:methionyl-tRNA formyltransferase